MATRMRQLSRGSSYLTGNAILASIVDRIRLADDERARRDTCAYRALAAATGSPVQRYIAATLDVLWSLYDGRFDDAEAAICAAERFGRRVRRHDRPPGRRRPARRAGPRAGDLAASPEFLTHLDEHRPADGRIPVWSLAVAWLHADCGLIAAAADRLRPIAERTDDFRALPRGPHRIVALAFAAETIFRLDQAGSATPCDRRTARRVSEALRGAPRPAGAARLAGRPSRSDAVATSGWARSRRRRRLRVAGPPRSAPPVGERSPPSPHPGRHRQRARGVRPAAADEPSTRATVWPRRSGCGPSPRPELVRAVRGAASVGSARERRGGDDVAAASAAAEVAERTAAGRVNRTDDRSSRTVGEIIRANVFTRFNAVIAALMGDRHRPRRMARRAVRVRDDPQPGDRRGPGVAGQVDARPPVARQRTDGSRCGETAPARRSPARTS